MQVLGEKNLEMHRKYQTAALQNKMFGAVRQGDILHVSNIIQDDGGVHSDFCQARDSNTMVVLWHCL